MKKTDGIIKNIVEKCAVLDMREKRGVDERHCELVFSNKIMPELEKIVIGILGPAVKPPFVKPAAEDIILTKQYGGIYESQTLFKNDRSGLMIIAMFWPWQTESYTTVKVFIL